MPPKGKKQVISSGEYNHLCEIGVAYEGIVELESGLLLYVYCETAVTGHFENRHHISYGTTTKSYEVPVCPQDNTRVDTQGQALPVESKYSKSDIERKVRGALISKLSDYTQGKSRRPVNARLTEDDKYYGSLHDKIENGTIKRSDFERRSHDRSMIYALGKEIDVYFACFDPVNPNYKSFWGAYESPFGSGEDWIPVWGQAKLAGESLNRGLGGYGAGHYFHAVGFFLLGVADLCSFGMESAIVKGLNSTGKTISGAITQKAVAKRGRLGNSATKSQIAQISTELERRGYTITGGGGRAAEEFLKPLGGGRKGGSYLDITAVHPSYQTLRINTVDVLIDGITPTARESRNAVRIRIQIAPGEHLLLIPKR